MKKIMTILLAGAVLFSGCSLPRITELPETDTDSSFTADGLIVTEELAEAYDFSAEAYRQLTRIASEFPNRDAFAPEGADNMHDACVAFIVSELEVAGYAEEDISLMLSDVDYWGQSHTITNIQATLKGRDDTKQIIIGAHYDGDGVGDNGSGTALLLSTAAGLKAAETLPEYTIKMVFFDAEEYGLYGSYAYTEEMSSKDADRTVFFINMDALSFGDYCNIYGGSESLTGKVKDTEVYDYAVDIARSIGITVYTTEDLDGYYASHGCGPEIDEGALYTNPWTRENPAPANNWAYSPMTIPASDHVGFMDLGIPYVYFEATNWYADGGDPESDIAYTGYYETTDTSIGENGMFMNTEYDTLENMESYFPGRALKHFSVYSRLLSALAMGHE